MRTFGRGILSSSPLRRIIPAVVLPFFVCGCGKGVGVGAGGSQPYYPADVHFAAWDSLGTAQCRGWVFNQGFEASDVRVQLWYATPSGEMSQVASIPGTVGTFRGASFFAAPQLTGGEPRFPRVGTVTFSNEQGNYGGSSPAQPRTPDLELTMVWCQLDGDSVQCEVKNHGGYAYGVVVHLDTRDGPRDVALAPDPLPYGVKTRLSSVVGDSAGVPVSPRVTSVHWEDYGGTPGDLISPTTSRQIYDCSPPTLSLQWGGTGSGEGEFQYPTGIAIGAGGNIYVADTGNDRIQVFSSTGTYVTRWGGSGTGNGQFRGPRGIAVAANGNVYVADGSNDRIEVFNSSGTYITQWGSTGIGNGQFHGPSWVAVGEGGAVYVVDSDRIQVFTGDGAYVFQWGGYGFGNGQFAIPSGVAAAASGNVLVADRQNNRIQVFTSTGAYVAQWSTRSPTGVAFDSDGNIFVTNYDLSQVQEFTGSGGFITQWGMYGSGSGQFKYPTGVAVDVSGSVYVADSNNNRIEKFDFAPSAVTFSDRAGNPFR